MRPGVLLLLLACGGGEPSASQPDADPGAGTDSGPGGEELAGEIVVLDGGGYGHLWQPPVVFGGIYAAGPPVWHSEVLRSGDCRVLTYEPGFCDGCDGVCLAPDECHPWPERLSAGTITVEGVAGDPIGLDPEPDKHYQTWGGLPDPLFAAGAAIEMSATGDEVPGFVISAEAPSRLTIAAFDELDQAVLLDGADIELSWPGADATSRVHLLAHSGGAFHGTPPQAMLECDAPDTGSLVLTEAALAALPEISPGCAKMRDCAKLGIMRYRRGVATTDAGEVALTIGAGINYPLTSE